MAIDAMFPEIDIRDPGAKLKAATSSQNGQAAQITQARQQTIQERATADAMPSIALFPWLTTAGQLVAPWWSSTRDAQLRNFWKKNDHLAGALYTIQARLTTMRFKVIPRDRNIREHVIEAGEMTELLRLVPEFGQGWHTWFSMAIEDLLTTDNGFFAEIIGEGEPDGPIVGAPSGVAHLDSLKCMRTRNPEFPVIYTDTDGARYKLHYTRVMYASQMPSPIVTMNQVGMCAISRCINVAQNLTDILTYKQEKLGSRPARAIYVTGGGLDPEDLQTAFVLAQNMMDNENLSRFSKSIVVGDATLPDASLSLTDLASIPDGFNERDSVTLGMAAIALAFAVDARELFPAMTAGATRADALLQHLKQRGKGIGQILEMTETLFNQKFLPPHLHLIFDPQDDAEDRQAAEIHDLRSLRRDRDLLNNAVGLRTTRERMLQDGEISHAQFIDMELSDGRLEDGTPVLALFVSDDADMRQLLSLDGITEPLNFPQNRESVSAQDSIRKAIVGTYEWQISGDPKRLVKGRQAQAALEHLLAEYTEQDGPTLRGETESGETSRDEPRNPIDSPRPEENLMNEELDADAINKDYSWVRKKFERAVKSYEDYFGIGEGD
jgi:hypothetical protein